MYELGKQFLLRIVRVPHDPAAPEGSATSLRVFRASPRYWQYRLVGWALGQIWVVFAAVVGLIAIHGALERGDAPSAVGTVFLVLETAGLVAVAGGALVSYVALRLDYEMRWYMVTDRSLRIREGVWHVHEMTMTFANIQNISISQGPLQRLFGIADLKVQSAGGGGGQQAEGGRGHAMRDLHVGWFRGVDDAPAIRDLVLERLRLLRDAGLGDHDDVTQATPAAAAPHPAAGPRPAVASRLVPILEELRDEASRLRRAAAGLP